MNQSIIFLFKFLLTPLMFILLLIILISSKTTPLLMLINLLTFSICTVLNLSKLFESNLFSYLTFLMMTGGILVLFSFFLSLTSNTPNFKKKSSLFMKIFITLMLLLILSTMAILSQKLMIFNYQPNNEYTLMTQQSLENYYFNINKMYQYPNNLLICMMILYLLVSLTFITKICCSNNKPLRKSN